MTPVWSVAAICLVGAVLAALLKKSGPELAVLLAVAVTAAAAALLWDTLGDIVDFLRQMMELGGMAPELFAPLLKTVAIALVSRVGGDLCRDAGEGAMASVLEMAGSFSAILVSLPLFEAVWDMLRSLL